MSEAPNRTTRPEQKNLNGSNKTSSVTNKSPPTLDSDTALLRAMLKSLEATNGDGSDEKRSMEELEELLSHMDDASRLADGVEGRLDALLAGPLAYDSSRSIGNFKVRRNRLASVQRAGVT